MEASDYFEDDGKPILDGKSVTTREPLVSVVVPAYNAASTVERALASIWCQQVPLEAIIVDDGSTDDTRRVVEQVGTTDMRLLSLEQNSGAAEARNRAIRLARGRYVAFLDADDEWLPGKLERQVEVLETCPGCSLVSCDVVVQWLDGRRTNYHDTVRVTEGNQAWKALLRGNFIPTPTVMVRRADLLRLGGFNRSLPYAEDLDLWIRLALEGEVRVLPMPLAVVHELSNSLTKRVAFADLHHTLPMVESHVSSLASRLTSAERRAILGARYFGIGYQMFPYGEYGVAKRLFAASIRCRYRVMKSAYYLTRSVGPFRPRHPKNAPRVASG